MRVALQIIGWFVVFCAVGIVIGMTLGRAMRDADTHVREIGAQDDDDR